MIERTAGTSCLKLCSLPLLDTFLLLNGSSAFHFNGCMIGDIASSWSLFRRTMRRYSSMIEEPGPHFPPQIRGMLAPKVLWTWFFWTLGYHLHLCKAVKKLRKSENHGVKYLLSTGVSDCTREKAVKIQAWWIFHGYVWTARITHCSVTSTYATISVIIEMTRKNWPTGQRNFASPYEKLQAVYKTRFSTDVNAWSSMPIDTSWKADDPSHSVCLAHSFLYNS